MNLMVQTNHKGRTVVAITKSRSLTIRIPVMRDCWGLTRSQSLHKSPGTLNRRFEWHLVASIGLPKIRGNNPTIIFRNWLQLANLIYHQFGRIVHTYMQLRPTRVEESINKINLISKLIYILAETQGLHLKISFLHHCWRIHNFILVNVEFVAKWIIMRVSAGIGRKPVQMFACA